MAQEAHGLILEVGKEFNREIRSVEKLGLYYVTLNSRLSNARQLREFAARAIEHEWADWGTLLNVYTLQRY